MILTSISTSGRGLCVMGVSLLLQRRSWFLFSWTLDILPLLIAGKVFNSLTQKPRSLLFGLKQSLVGRLLQCYRWAAELLSSIFSWSVVTPKYVDCTNIKNRISLSRVKLILLSASVPHEWAHITARHNWWPILIATLNILNTINIAVSFEFYEVKNDCDRLDFVVSGECSEAFLTPYPALFHATNRRMENQRRR